MNVGALDGAISGPYRPVLYETAPCNPINSFSQMCEDIVDARAWSGIHFRFADEQSEKIGRRVAHWGNRHTFR